MRLCIVQPSLNLVSETFFRAQAERLPCDVCIVHHNGGLVPYVGTSPVLSQAIIARAFRKSGRVITRRPWNREITSGYICAFRRFGAEAVLAQYGTTGVAVLQACQECRVPLIVHFHGFDASMHSVIAEHSANYERLFAYAAAIVAGCGSMKRRLIALGASPEKVHVNYVSTVDTNQFVPQNASDVPPRFIAVGRFVEKKAPHLTLIAFAKVKQHVPEASLTMIGDGPLLTACKDLAISLRIDKSVRFLGAQPSAIVRDELSKSRCFVQHSVVASNGDSEGTSISVLEASATGLPVVATCHEGIAETMVDGETGYLVDEFDIDAMANAMIRTIRDPLLCSRLGNGGRRRVESRFSIDHSISGLWKIIVSATGKQGSALSLTRSDNSVSHENALS
jgi:colanic acid/amylovoran biosynthesis glycosyltransferase